MVGLFPLNQSQGLARVSGGLLRLTAEWVSPADVGMEALFDGSGAECQPPTGKVLSCIQAACLGARLVWLHSSNMAHLT